MKKVLVKSLALFFVGSLFVAGSAFATPYNGRTGPVTFGTSPETTLQEIFDTAITEGSLDASSDQSDVAIWAASEGDVDAYLVKMIKGHVGNLGIYSYANNSLTYDFGDDAVDASFSILNNGVLKVGSTFINGFGSSFGFYWRDTAVNPNTYAYTEDDRNGGTALALAYQLTDDMEVTYDAGGGYTGTFAADGGNDWILAFEDVPNGDFDFNDAVFIVEDIAAPVPEPATMLLLGTGMVGLAGFSRRKKAAKK